MKRILFLVRGYYPDLSASGNLIAPLVEELGKKNTVCVLSCASKNSLPKKSGNIHLYRVPISQDNKNLTGKFIRFLNRTLMIKHHKKEIVSKFENEIIALNKRYDFDIIIGVTFEEILALLNTNILINKKNVFLLEKLPISSDIPLISKLKKRYKKKVERDIIEKTNLIYALPIMYDYLNESHQIHTSKFIKLEHPMIINKVQKKEKKKNDYISLIYAGGLDQKQRNPTILIKLLKKINQSINIKVSIYSYGNTSKILKHFSKENKFLNSNSPIDSQALDKKITDTDIILTLGNKEADIVPSKIFDCISTGKPIIHFSQVDSDPYYEYLKKYKNSLIIKYSKAISESDYLKIITFLKKNQNVITNFSSIEQNYKECTPAYVANIIIGNSL